MFLDSIRERQEDEERQRKEKDGVEVMDFKRAVAARENATNKPPPPTISAPAPTLKLTNATPNNEKNVSAKKDMKRALKGVIVKKKPKVGASAPPTTEKRPAHAESTPDKPEAKRRRVDTES